jgi:hypothetical protein
LPFDFGLVAIQQSLLSLLLGHRLVSVLLFLFSLLLKPALLVAGLGGRSFPDLGADNDEAVLLLLYAELAFLGGFVFSEGKLKLLAGRVEGWHSGFDGEWGFVFRHALLFLSHGI